MDTLIPKIIYEDADLLVLNKPAGLAVQPDKYTIGFTLADWLAEKYPALIIVHRLDKDTSGVMLVAKNQSMFLWLKKQWQEHRVEKTYRAIVYGNVKKSAGSIDLPIGRSNRDPRQRVASQKAAGVLRPAVTTFQVLRHLGHFTEVELRPRTGRTHQLRVHLKAFGYPVVGDSLYAPKLSPPAGVTRQMLHAETISFTDQAGRRQNYTVPPPADYQATIDQLAAAC